VGAQVVVAIGVVGGLGAIGRFLLDDAVARRLPAAFPFGTLAVNLTGSFALGALVGATLGDVAFKTLGTGLVGAYTTFSTWVLECHRLAEDGQPRLAVANCLLTLLAGLFAVWVGRRTGMLL
jgi:CrcB protein